MGFASFTRTGPFVFPLPNFLISPFATPSSSFHWTLYCTCVSLTTWNCLLKCIHASSLFAVPFSLTYHVPSRFTPFSLSYTGCESAKPPAPSKAIWCAQKEETGCRPLTQHPQTIWLTLMNHMDHMVNLFCSQFTRNKRERAKEV